MKWSALYREGTKALLDAGIPEAGYDARELLLFAGKTDLSGYAMHSDEETNPETAALYQSLIERRKKAEPLQYITGTAPFMGHSFRVRPGVLIPRYDTETLVSAALSKAEDGMRVLDLCTGSGCVLLSILKEGGDLQGTGTDLCPEALAVARENAEALGASARFLAGDLFEALAQDFHPKYNKKDYSRDAERFDLIVSNPPYIPTDCIASLMAEVRVFEPRTALDGGADGLVFYRRIVPEAKAYLNPGGCLLVEHGADQGNAVAELFAAQGYREIETVKDLCGQDRVTAGRWYE